MRIRTALLACSSLAALALVGCGPKPEESTAPPVVPPKDGASAPAPAEGGAPTGAAPGGRPSGPPTGTTYSGGNMPPELKARLQQQGAPVK